MSNFKLKISFGGMCAFVPESTGQKLWVLLVNARQPQKLGVQPHAPVLRFELRDLDGVTNAPPTKGFWGLAGYDMEIKTGGAGGLQIRGFNGGLAKPNLAAPASDDDFSWVASVEEACVGRGFPQGTGKVKPQLLQPSIPPQFRSLVAARLPLTEGSIKVEEVAKYGNSKVVWRFRPYNGTTQPSDHRQFVASRVVLEIPVSSPTVEVHAKRFDGTGATKLVLRPPVTNPGADVLLELFNEESGQIVGVSSPPPITANTARPEDQIFEAFGSLLQQPPPDGAFPIPVAEGLLPPPLLQDIITLGSPPCATGRLEA